MSFYICECKGFMEVVFDWQESWQLRKGCVEAPEEDVEFEEELYTAGNVVVWTKGSRAHGSNIYKAFTVDSPVEQVSRG